MSINSTSAYWSMMQKVDQGDYEVVFRKKEPQSPFIHTLSCGAAIPIITGDFITSTFTGTPSSYFGYLPSYRAGHCIKCDKKVDALYCYKCITEANK